MVGNVFGMALRFFLCCFVTDLFHMKYFCKKKKAEKFAILKFVLFVLCHVYI